MNIFALLFLFLSLYGCVSSIDPSSLIHLDLEKHLNHRAIGNDADVDGLGHHYLPKKDEPKSLVVGGLMSYSNPFYNKDGGDGVDNIRIQGNDKEYRIYDFSKNQSSSPGALYFLVSSSHGPVVADIKITYEKGNDTHQKEPSMLSRLVIPDWQQEKDFHQIEKWDVIARSVSNSNTPGGLYSIPVYIDPARTPISINMILPSHPLSSTAPSRGHNGKIIIDRNTSDDSNNTPSVHVFAISGVASTPESVTSAEEGSLQMTAARVTRRFWNDTTALIPVLLVRLHNVGSLWLDDITLSVSSSHVKTIYPGKLDHLAPGHVSSLDVGIQLDDNTQDDLRFQVTTPHGTLLDKTIQLLLPTQQQLVEYHTTTSSLQQHQAPTWYQQAKFGIFIHWGVYSVPAWAPVGQEYAEWYWWQMNHPSDPTHEYHQKRYGRGFAYDDFIPMWQPTLFNPRKWLELIDTSRAKYFVFTSKHHDGIALFDTKVTNRSSVRLQPHRDFVHDLITTSKEQYPHLKRGIYFSLPEWYHPKYKDSTFNDWGGPPFNPYTNKTIPYTGSTQIDDFVNDLQLPQFLELVNNYEPDMIWCDIGGINNSSMWQAEFYNKAAKQNRQVTINDRCGNGVSDFTTLEYQQTSTPPSRSWEATRGIDPRSFGFNQATPPEKYASSEQLVYELVDAVSMGGNFLLNIGPSANGSVFHTMVERLHDIGAWLDQNGDSVFNADPYWLTTQDKDVRYMMGHHASAVYILVLNRSAFTDTNQLVLTTPLPLRSSTSSIHTIGGNESSLPWKLQQDDSTGVMQTVISNIPDDFLSHGKYVWVLKCSM